jgi:DNA-binding NtrC family response regulator
MAVDCEGSVIEPQEFELYMRESGHAAYAPSTLNYQDFLYQTEVQFFKTLLKRYSNKEELAQNVGMSRSTLYRKLADLQLT